MADAYRPGFSGERFTVVYRLMGTETEARQSAEAICIEQTIEFPEQFVTDPEIRAHVFGRIESWKALGPQRFEAAISYANEISGWELPQLLNVIFGNSSLKPGIWVERLELPDSLLAAFKGPRFGRAGLREWLGIPERPLLCTAIKPMGLSVSELAELTYRFALGGIEIIKDDHGLADQPFSPFAERVRRCAEAVQRANAETGGRSIYVPNVTAPAHRMMEQVHFAKEAGAGGLLIAPGLVGFDTMHAIAEDDSIGLPILSHPAFQGTFVTSTMEGISHQVLFGQIARLAGADVTIFPNFGGRFSFSREACLELVAGTEVPMGTLRPIFPAPAGGMTLERIPEMRALYGREVVFLVGGALQSGPDIVETCLDFRQIVEEAN